MKPDKTKIAMFIFLLVLIIWTIKKVKDEITGSSFEGPGIPPFSWVGEFHPPMFTIARVKDNLQNLFSLTWWSGLWETAAYRLYSDPEANQMMIDTWINAGITAEGVLLNKVNTGYFTAMEGYQWLQEIYGPVFMDYRMCLAASFAATQLEIYANSVNTTGGK